MLGPNKTVFSQSVGRTFRLCRFAQYGIISILQIRKELSVFLKKKKKGNGQPALFRLSPARSSAVQLPHISQNINFLKGCFSQSRNLLTNSQLSKWNMCLQKINQTQVRKVLAGNLENKRVEYLYEFICVITLSRRRHGIISFA